ncbi:MAG: preprotein translocase subunit SecG [Rhizobiaceae bacterium]|nr:preprotein translocase subunit SecG [Rhizobiaceae bacterium]
METVIIVVHLMIVLALVGVVLLQRSEGGGLGIGGGSGFMTARGTANVLTRATAILAAAFFATSLGLSLIARYGAQPLDILDRQPVEQGQGQGVLDQLGGGSDIPAPPATTPPASDNAATAPAEPASPEATTPEAGTPAQPATPEVVAPAQPDASATQPAAPEAPAAEVPGSAAPSTEPQVPNQ